MRAWNAGAALTLALVASSCAEERPPIDRVQPNVLEKTFFVGPNLLDPADDPEFWAQGTLVDVGYGAAQDGLFTSTYAAKISRIKWVIQEHQLLGRLTYERIEGSDGKGAGAASTDGQVVAAYPIVSHFDIQREYNPISGEEINVVSENTSDRPWYERQYMRVDWSRNLNTDAYDFDTLSAIGVYGGVKYEPLAYYVTDPTSEDAPHFDLASGYFDVTNKAFATPQLIDLSHLGWGIDSLPACWLDNDFMGGTAPAANCNPVELTIRQAFRKVVDTDYEPADWDGYRFQAFGAFTVERSGYARNYGMSDDQLHRFITRYNIWERSHHYENPKAMTGEVACFTPETTKGGDPHVDADGDGTEDECAVVGRGSRCDTFRQRCTLPFRDRKPVTQPWYYTSGSNPEFFEGTEWATHEWDVALRTAVASARYEECKRTKGKNCAQDYPVYFGQMDDASDAIALSREVDDCRNGRAYAGKDCTKLASELGKARGYTDGVIAIAKMDEMLVLCHSPVEAADHPACGGPRLPEGMLASACAGDDAPAACRSARSVRMGDLRYHQINVITQPQTPSPWGIYTDAEDPLTGEKVAASVNVWSHVTDLWSQGVVDQARYIRGELSTADVTEGTYVRDWVAASEAAANGGSLPKVTREELNERVASFTHVTPERLRELGAGGLRDARIEQKLRQLKQQVQSIRADAHAPSANRPLYSARRKAAQGSQMEAELTTKMMQELVGANSIPNSDRVLELASPLRGTNPSLWRDLRNLREVGLAEQGTCIMHEHPAPLGIPQLAKLLEEKFGAFNPSDSKPVQLARAEKMRRYLAQRAQYSVIIHEMGHSVGLRHNFVSSSDAWGYRPQYWQLRTEDGKVSNPCTQLTPDGSCVGPRYFDPVTQNESDNLISMFMNSTTMDYAGETTQDMLGIGAYDFAAARAFYGDIISVHADPSYNVGTPRSLGMLNKMDNFGGILGIQPSIGSGTGSETRDIHYSQLQREFELIGDCAEVDPNRLRPANWNEERDGKWHPLLDGLIVKVDGKYTRCRQQPVDYVSWQSLRPARAAESGGRGGPSVDPTGRVRVPYGFATDSWADLGNLSVYRHDNGADAYELFDFFITQQEVGHIFDNYRRNRQGFSVRSASSRTLSRYNEKLRDAAKGLGLLVNIYRDFAVEIGVDFNSYWPIIAKESFADNILASQIAFDHFARQLARPEAGPHFYFRNGFVRTDPVLRSASDALLTEDPSVTVPNGATGLFGNITYGGRPVENALASDKGEYDSQYTINAGSYYDKAYTAMLMTESVDNFISDSRRDFIDGRYRSVSVADVFPEGFRRWLANNLTGDDAIKGPRLAADSAGNPLVDGDGYPTSTIGWTSWWPASGPTSCFPQLQSMLCSNTPTDSVPIDPQVGWEQQKFLIAFTLLYLPENQKQNWVDMMRVWEIGADTDPGFDNRIEFHDPAGKIFVAKTYGKEAIFGKTVQRGIAARVLEHANELVRRSYVVADGPDIDGDGTADWYEPVLGVNGLPTIKYDASIATVAEGPNGTITAAAGRPGCNSTDSSQCTCESNRACVALAKYTAVPLFLRQSLAAFGFGGVSMRGIY